MQIAGRRRVPKTHARDYTLRDEIPGRKRRKRKRIDGGRAAGRGQDRAADINNATCISGLWKFGASAQRLSLPT